MVSAVAPANYAPVPLTSSQPENETDTPVDWFVMAEKQPYSQTNNCLRRRAETSRCTLQTR